MLIIFMYFEIFIINKLKTFLLLLRSQFHLLCVDVLQALFIFLILFANSFLGRGPSRPWDFSQSGQMLLNRFSVPMKVRSSI